MDQSKYNRFPLQSEYMSLGEKIKTYEYPEANENRLIIKMNETSYGYIKDYEETA